MHVKEESDWRIVPYQGGSHFKRCRVRRIRVIDTILSYVRRHEYTVVLGPAFNEKTRLLHDVAQELEEDPAFAPIYVNLRQARTDTESIFYTSLAQLIGQGLAHRSPRSPRPRQLVQTLDFQKFLSACLAQSDCHLALLIDHLQVLPQDLIHGLLKALRSVYMERNPIQHQHLDLVMTGSVSLADLSLSPSSPFNIARPIVLEPLTHEQSLVLAQATLAAHGKEVSDNALEQILHWAGGDCYLIPYLCDLAQEVMAGYRRPLVTTTVVKQAVQRLWQIESARWPINEAIQTIEGDMDTLMDVLDLLERGTLAKNQARQVFSRTGTNRLQLSGAVAIAGEEYHFKNEIYRRALREHLTPARVGHVMRMAGRWQEAIRYLAPTLSENQTGDARADLLEAIVQSIYAADNLDEAYKSLVQGMHEGFGVDDVAIYAVDAAESELRLVHTDDPAVPNEQRIALSELTRVEVRTFHNNDYSLRGDASAKRLVAALTPEKRPIGVVSVGTYEATDHGRGLPPDLLELLRFLRHAASAIENVMWRSAFQEIGRAVLDVNALESSLTRVLTSVSNALGCDFSLLYLIDEHQPQLVRTVEVGPPVLHHESRIDLRGSHAAVRALGKLNPAAGPDAPDPSLVPLRGGLDVPARVVLPLVAAGRALGVLELGFERTPQPQLSVEYRNTLHTFADQVAIAVHNMQLLRRTDDALSERVRELEAARRELEALRKRELLSREQELTDLANILSHRLGTAAGDVPFALKIVRQGLNGADPRPIAALAHVQNSFDDLLDLMTLLESLLMLPGIQFTKLDLRDVVRETVARALFHSALDHSLVLPPHPVWINGNAPLLRDALLSVIQNACEALAGQGKRGVIEVQLDVREHGTALLTIADTGPGIPDEYRARIFAPGFSTKSSSKRNRGRGLFICRSVLHKHHGTVDFHSEVGRGTIFLIELPSLHQRR